MSEPDRRYWFPAKRFGWGWGPPRTWEGWLFVVVWFAVLLAGTALRPGHPGRYVLFVVGMLAVMLAVCWAKGEPPKWRWGDRKPPGT
jgi:hypothetical protein